MHIRISPRVDQITIYVDTIYERAIMMNPDTTGNVMVLLQMYGHEYRTFDEHAGWYFEVLNVSAINRLLHYVGAL